MKALGLIVEYNPFHNGHLHHLRESQKQAQSDVVIAVMSGHFTQRGEPALLDKWHRTQTALDAGVDLVAELPYAYATQHAEIFAKGAISILSHLQADCLIFGSEIGKISQLHKIEALTRSENFQIQLKKHLSTGLSLPKAQSLAIQDLGYSQKIAQQPNNTLGIHYLKAINELHSPLIAGTIPRIHSAYAETAPSHSSITSATAIRNLLATGQPVQDFIPPSTLKQLFPERLIPSWEPYFASLRQKILTLGPDGLRDIHDMKEGLEQRFYQSAITAQNFEALMEQVKTKRYTRTRLQRICAHILTHTTGAFIKNLDLDQPAPYVRILGMSPTGRRYLNHIKKQIPVPLYSKFSETAHPMLKHEQKVTGAYGTALSPRIWTQLNVDEFSHIPILS